MQNILKDLAIIKKIIIEISKSFSRNDIFFLYKNDLVARRDVYEKDFYVENNNQIICKSLCQIIKKELDKYVKCELLYTTNVGLMHCDLVVYVDNKKFIIDPLADLVNIKNGLDLQHFCSKKKINSLSKVTNVIEYNCLTDDENSIINNLISYIPKNTKIYNDYKNKDINYIFSNISIIHNSSTTDNVIYLNFVLNNLLKLNIKINTFRYLNEYKFGLYFVYNHNYYVLFDGKKIVMNDKRWKVFLQKIRLNRSYFSNNLNELLVQNPYNPLFYNSFVNRYVDVCFKNKVVDSIIFEKNVLCLSGVKNVKMFYENDVLNLIINDKKYYLNYHLDDIIIKGGSNEKNFIKRY